MNSLIPILRKFVRVYLVLFAVAASAQTVKDWNGSSNPDWFNPTNWIPSGVPAAGDTINFSSGTINLTAPVVHSGLFNWSSGTLSGNGLTIATNGVLTLSTSGTKYVQNALTNAGVVTWTGGTVYVMNNNSPTYRGVVENLPGALWDIRCDQSLATYFGGTNAFFRNQGTMQKSTLTGTTTVSIPLHNAGLVTVQQGTLNFNNGGTIESNYTTLVGTTVNFSAGTFSYTTPPVLSGAGTFLFSGGALTLLNNVILNLQMTGGTLTLSTNFQGGVITNLVTGGALTGNYTVRGTLTLGNGVTGGLELLSGSVLNWSGGTISTGLQITNGATVNWSGGNLSSNSQVQTGGVLNWSSGTAEGPITVAVGAAMNLILGGTKYVQNALTNAGVVTWTGGTVYVMNNNTPTYRGVVENLAGALWDIRCDQSLATYFGGTNAFFRNQGTMQKSTLTGTTTVSIPLHNAGLVAVQQGTLNFNNGGTVESNYTTLVGTTVNFSAGTFSYTTPPVLSGAGAYLFSGGALTLLNNVIPNLQMTGGTLTLSTNFQGGVITNLTLAGSLLSGTHIVSGIFNCGGGISGSVQVTNGGVMNWSGGNVSSNLNVVAGGLVNWSSGTAEGPITVAVGAAMNLILGGTKYVQNALTNAGVVTWTGGTVYVMNNNSPTYKGVVENLPGALWDIRCDQSLATYFGGSAAFFRNQGTVQKSTTTGTTSVSLVLNNAGVLRVLTGSFNFNPAGTYVQSGATLNFGLTGTGLPTPLNMTGNLGLDGTLSADYLNSYTPSLGHSITLIACGTLSNSFQHLNLPSPGANLGWRVAYAANGVSLQVISNSITTAQITGSVTDQTSAPVSNLTVFAFTTNLNNTLFLSTTTDASGNYSLAVTNGTWFVGLKNLPSRGYNPVTNHIAVINNANQTINFVLEPFSGVLDAISTTVNPVGAGTSSGDGVYPDGSTVIVTASANTNALPYYFSSWTENSVLQSASSTYVFAAQRNRQLVANFTLPAFTIVASNNPSAAGTVSGAGTNFFASTNVLSAQANFGYTFTNWTENGLVLGTNLTLTTVVYSNRVIVANYVEANLLHTVTTATSPGGIAAVSGAGNYTNGQTASFSAPASVLSSPFLYTFLRFTLSNNLVTTSPSFNKTFATTDHTNLHYVAVYNTVNIVPQLTNTAANYPNPVPATTNLVLTFRFDRSMQANVTPLVYLTNSATVTQPTVGTNGYWTSFAMLNDSYVTPGIALVAGMDGTNKVFLSGAQDTNGYTVALTNSLNLTVDATFPVLSNVSATPAVLTAAVVWNSSEAAMSQVEYGTNTAYGSSSGLDSQLVTTHGVTLYNLTPLTTYHYRVRSRDLASNETVSADNTFTTFAAPDLQVTNLAVTGNFISGGSVLIAWTDTNSGVGDTFTYWYDRVIVTNSSTGETLLNTVAFYDPVSSGNVASGAARNRQYTFTLPNGASGAGSLQILVTANIYGNQYEANGSGTANINNTAVLAQTSTLAAYPELRVTGLMVTNAQLRSGNLVGVTWQNTNSGSGAVSNLFYDRITVVNVTNGQTLINTFVTFDSTTAGGIAAGGFAGRHFNFTLPDGPTGAGDFQITVTADSLNSIYEFNLGGTAEVNNTSSIVATSLLSAYPDLIVTNIISPLVANAGQPVQIVWTDVNQGTSAATNAWFDQVFLTSSNAIGGGQLVGTFGFTNSLAAGQSVTVTQSVTLPQFVSGNQWFVLKANVAEAFYESSIANNSAITTNSTTLVPTLQLTLSPDIISESAGNNAALVTVARSGVLTNALTVTLGRTLTNITLASSVVLPVGVNATNIYLGVIDNAVSGNSASGIITASAAGFATVTNALSIIDDDVAALTIAVSTNVISEDAGTGAITGTITRNANLTGPLTVRLASDLTSALLSPPTVTIPADKTSITFGLTPVADGVLGGTRRAHVTASALGYTAVSVTVEVLNTDVVELSLGLANSVVSEGAGNNATVGTVTRSVITTSSQNVQLTRTGSALVTVPAGITIPANAASVNFYVSVGSDGLVTGNQAASITASPLNLAYGVETLGADLASIQILDTNGPTLSLQLADALIAKGSNTVATIFRNTPPTNSMTVNLSASPSGRVTLPGTVNFAVNQTTVTCLVTGVLDGVQTGNRDVVITASAAGFNSAAKSLVVSDIYLPDLIPSAISAPPTALTEQQITVSWKISNNGLGGATNQSWHDYVYLSTESYGGSQVLVALRPNVKSLAVGESYTNSATFYLPTLPADFRVIVEANGNRTLTELNTANNTALSAQPIAVNPVYRAVLTNATPLLAASGTPIVLRGRTYNPTNNAPAPFRAASIRVIVDETRRVFPVTSDANGNFSYTFQPLSNEAGDYIACADHPNVTNISAQVSFSLIGFAALPTSITHTLLPSSPVSGTLLLSNLTRHALSGLAFTTPNLGTNLTAQFTFTNTTLPSNGVVGVQYTIQSPITRASQFNFNTTFTTTQGATLAAPTYIKVVPTLAQLVASPAFLTRGMVRGQQTVVSFTIENNGGSESGDLIVQIPGLAWMSLGSTTNIPSLPAGGSTTVTLLLNPAHDLTLGLYNGNIVVFNQNVGLTIPYQFRAVSDGMGDLVVNVTDDYTYYVAGEPKVTNATVVLRDPFTGSIVAQTNSGTAGIARFKDLAEGGYTVDVSAEKHNQFRGTATVVASLTNTLEAFMPRQLVTYQWSVVPTEIADHYKIVLESVFETEVPVPNVVVSEPQVMLLVAPGEVTQFEIKLTNHGLIAAENVSVSVPFNATYLITPLVEVVGKIPAKSSVTVPVTVQLRSTAIAKAEAKAKGLTNFGKLDGGGGCTLEDLNGCLPKIPLRVNYSYPCGGNNVNQNRSVDLSIICTANSVKECWDNIVGVAGSVNMIGVACNTLSAFLACVGNGLTPCQSAAISTACGAAVGFATGGPAGAAAGGASGGASGILACICSHLDLIPFPTLPHSNGGPGRDVLGWLPLPGPGTLYSVSAPVVTLIEIPGGNCSSGPSPSFASVSSTRQSANPFSAPRLSAAHKTDASSGVCARVRIRINQDVVMTRSAFVGTLEIDNGGDTAITGVQVTLDFRDGAGVSAATKFVTEGPVLSQLTSVNGAGTLAGGATGSAVYTFIPTTDAAPDRPYSYQIGGTLRYVDGGQEVIVPLLSAPITVYPEAKLNLVYFQQRDVYGDDPFTVPVEPSEPYTLGLIVKNIGAGDAKNFEITSAQPQIIENEKGLLIDFSIIGTRVESNAVSPSLTAKVGTIPAGAAKEVTWQLLSTLQGKFISFEASFEHVDGLGRTNLSLINSIETHELIHTVLANRTNDNAIPDFLVNDFADPQHLPDLLYLNNGSVETVNVVTNGSVDGNAGAGHLQVQLTTSVSNGWNYIKLPDPGAGFILANVMRSDGKIIALTNNAWTTARSFPSSSPGAIKENLLHLFDWAGTGSYTLNYRSTNTTAPYIVQIVPVTPFTQPAAVSDATIIFSEQINLSTFTYSALTLTRNGGANLINAGSGVSVTLVSNATYTINGLAPLTVADGNYTLTVNGSTLYDVWGNNAGNVSASISWAKGNAAPVVQSITAVSPNPRNTPVTSLLITFSKAINPATFDQNDCALTLNGGANLITTANTMATSDNIHFTISGLGALTGAEGDFVFTAAATAVQDTFATSGQGSQSSAWTMITTQPRITAVQQVATNPRNIVVQTLNVTFSHAIDPATFTYSDLALTRNGGANLINSGVTITALNATNYQLGEISWLQGLAGNYSLTVNAAAINDLAGNSGSGSTNVAWQMILDTPPTPANLVIAPDLGISATDGLTSTNPITLSGTIGTTNLTVRIYDESVATDLGVATVTGTNFAASLYIATPGTHRLKVTAIDVAGNVSPASYTTAFLDQIRPTASFTPVAGPVYSAINPVNVLCSEGINPATLSLASFSITRDVTNTITPTITLVSTNIIQLGGLSAATYPLGIYTVTANLNGIQDYAGNIATNVLSLTWERVTSNLPPVLTAITNRVITPDGGFAFRAKATDPNGDKLTFALGAGTPADAVIVATNGLVRWNPTRARASTTNQFSIIVTDNGYPFMSATNTFIVTVLDYLDVTFGQTNLLGGNTATLPIWISSSEGVSNVQFNLNVPSSVLTNWILIPESAQLASSTLQTQGSAIVVHLQTLPGQIIQGTQQVSHLEFKATTNQQSQFITLAASNIGGIKPGGIIYSNNVNGGGRVVVVQELPLLEGLILTNHSRQLSIYGRPGTNYELQTANAMTQPVTWSPVTSLTQTNVLSPITVSVTNSLIFYRLKQLP